MAKLYGYARASTDDQVTDLQRDALVRAGVAPEDIFVDEGVSGTKPALTRPGLSSAIGSLQAGDTLVVWKLDRLGRSVVDLLETVEGLRARGIHFRSLTEELSTSSPMGKMIFTIIASVAEMERGVIVERTKAGLEAAKARGTKMGRPPISEETKRVFVKSVRAGATTEEVAKAMNLSPATGYRIMAESRRTA
jgi:DNA invertase Pin-like site-specific DNA recombinase